MQVTFKYFAQVRQAAGTETETVQLDDGTPLHEAIIQLASGHGPEFRQMLFDASDAPHPSLMLLLNGQAAGLDRPLADGDTVSVLSAVAGG